MSERQAAHQDRNLARALTPAEKRDKKLKKLFEGDGMGSSSAGSTSTLAAVYRVESLAHGQHRFKVDVNAKENHMTGVMGLGSVDFGVFEVRHEHAAVLMSFCGEFEPGRS
jgi:U4/U6 small nuclear ribonucleoprotein PRP3